MKNNLATATDAEHKLAFAGKLILLESKTEMINPMMITYIQNKASE